MLLWLRVGYTITKDVKVALDLFILFDRMASDIDYCHASRVTSDAEGATDIHLHPVEPRSIDLTLIANL